VFIAVSRIPVFGLSPLVFEFWNLEFFLSQSPKTKDLSPDHHSYLNATNGSTFVARRAGM
jgi:hypothetical protein